MKKMLVMLLAILAVIIFDNIAFAEDSFFDSIKFVQYLDENTALEEVRNGNLDLYYYRIASDRLETSQSREGLQVFDSTGGSYSILVNPAHSDKFNPFEDREIRFSLNYLIDRKLIVNELNLSECAGFTNMLYDPPVESNTCKPSLDWDVSNLSDEIR